MKFWLELKKCVFVNDMLYMCSNYFAKISFLLKLVVLFLQYYNKFFII